MCLWISGKANLDVLVDSRAYVSAVTQNELERIKKQARNNIFEINNSPYFQIQVGNGQLEKKAILKFDFGNKTSAEHFVLPMKLTG